MSENFRSFVLLLTSLGWFACSSPGTQPEPPAPKVPFSVAELQQRTFRYFWDLADSTYGQVPDRYPSLTFSSVAATGFGLTAYLVGIQQGYITREQGAQRVLKTLQALWNLPQGPDSTGVTGYKGFFYHFLTLDKAGRFKNVELSTIDTGLLMAGILAVQSFFDQENPGESEIRQLADQLFRRVEWDWAYFPEENYLSMGWHPEKGRGFIPARWKGYNEAMVLLIMAMGSPTHPIPAAAWQQWCSTYEWSDFQGFEHVNFEPLFGHQYSHMFIDFRGIQDAYMREKGIDYFENARRATLSNRAYCISNPNKFNGYGENLWGLTACDGPKDTLMDWKGQPVQFRTYSARGASAQRVIDDGTIAPTAAGGSVPFAPEVCLSALEYMWNTHYDQLVRPYGFADAFNPSFTAGIGNEQGWYDKDYLGIDQGPILIQIENYRSELIWDLMKKNPYIISGLQKAGFTGGWLDEQGE